MPISPYILRLRGQVGHDLLLLPSVSVLPRDDEGRVLLVRQSDDGQWGTIGGAVEVDEDPRGSAVREAQEEAGIEVELAGIRDVLGGPGFRRTYPNGDQVAYVSTVFDARVVGGEPTPDHDETTEVRWFDRAELSDPGLDLGDFARLSLTRLGLLDPPPATRPGGTRR